MKPTDKLKKSIDQLIDELFAPEVKKSMDHFAAATTADEAIKNAPSGEMDEARGAGRPKQISEIPQVDVDGKRAGRYDTDIVEDENKEEAPAEGEQVKSGKRKKEEESEAAPAKLPGMPESPVAPVEAPAEGEHDSVPEHEAEDEDDSIEEKGIKKSFAISKAQYAEYVALKKAREATIKAEVLRKAKAEHTSLIKSAVVEATADIRRENENLRKSLSEQSELIKAMANKPKAATAITSMSALEKGGSAARSNNGLSKADLVDIAERLVKSNELMLDSAIELDQTGFIVDPNERATLEKAIRSIRR
jgi:hypothetical protein